MQCADVRQRRLLRVAHVLQQRPGGTDCERQIIRAEALQIERTELVGQQARGAGELEVPRRTHPQCRARSRDGLDARALREQQLRGLQPLELGGERLRPLTLQHREAPGREIEPREPEALALARQSADQGVAPLLQQRGVRHGAGRDDAHHLALQGSL